MRSFFWCIEKVGQELLGVRGLLFCFFDTLMYLHRHVSKRYLRFLLLCNAEKTKLQLFIELK